MPLLPPLPSAEWLNPATQLVLKATLVLAAGGLATLLLRRADSRGTVGRYR